MTEHSLHIDTSGMSEDEVKEAITKVLERENRPGGLLHKEFDYPIRIPNELLHEIIDGKIESLRQELKDFTNDRIMSALYQVARQPQQPARSPDDVLRKSLADAITEGGQGVEKRLIAIIADFAAKNNWPEGQAIYQYLNLAYQRL